MNGSTSTPAAQPLRFITATSIYDGHDAAINIVRRIMQDQGVEVVHLGHNRAVDEIVSAALQEDVDGIAISSYQGGHVEFFQYLIDRLRQAGAKARVFGGGGGTISATEIAALEAYGVEKIYTPEDGRQMGLKAMVADCLARSREARETSPADEAPGPDQHHALGRLISQIENGGQRPAFSADIPVAPVIGITGTGGAGKSSVLDELLLYLLAHYPSLQIAVLAIDPTRHKSGGALLGDRIRLNSLASPRIFMRSMATRRRNWATSAHLADCIQVLKQSGFGLVIVETAGTGQADLAICDHVDLSLYVMTSDYGAPSQLEKIQMLDFADFVVLNKFDKRGAEDALRDIKRQWRRDHEAFEMQDEEVPVYATIASQWSDPGLQGLARDVSDRLAILSNNFAALPEQPIADVIPVAETVVVPQARQHYLAEIADNGRRVGQEVEQQLSLASQAQSYYHSLQALADPELPEALALYDEFVLEEECSFQALRKLYQQAVMGLSQESLALLREWPHVQQKCLVEPAAPQEQSTLSLSGTTIPKIALPTTEAWAEQLRFLLTENIPGSFPYTAGVFANRHHSEAPTRMFAGEGTPERTNRRFHFLAAGQQAKRLSTAFDPITLYGEDADERPDINGRIGMSGVSVSNLDDMKKLYSGFDLCDANTSVSMTINGPGPILLSWFLNVAIDQQVEKFLKAEGRWQAAQARIDQLFKDQARPEYIGDLPPGHNGLGLGLLGVTGEQLVDDSTYTKISQQALAVIRGTLQADILKEDQAQNECIFPLEFGLRMMADTQEYFIANNVRHYYGVSVSGYHIAEAGANPITQLAFTLANGFTLLEYYLARGMAIDDFAAQMSFFFSNGMDPEYAVIGRVARRIWARALRDVYGANARSQKLKYHIQTSGRTLHAQTLGFNDIRTTLQALYAIYDNCNSLHTNAYDEALTTPTETSVRRALAIQMIINQELGLNLNQNPLQGSYIIEQLTDAVEEAVYAEFERLSQRGGVLGAMESLYQRGKIQEESLYYEQRKHDGRVPIVGVNTFLDASDQDSVTRDEELIRSTEPERQAQVAAVKQFQARHADRTANVLSALQESVSQGENVFSVLMRVGKYCTLAQLSRAMIDVVGRYRRRV